MYLGHISFVFVKVLSPFLAQSTGQNSAFGTTNRVQGAQGTISAYQNDAFSTSVCPHAAFRAGICRFPHNVPYASGDILGLLRRICACPAFRYPPKSAFWHPPKCESWWVPECESWYPPKFRSAGPAHKAAGRRVVGRAAAFRYPPEFASWYPPECGWARRLAKQPARRRGEIPLPADTLQGVSTPPSPWHACQRPRPRGTDPF